MADLRERANEVADKLEQPDERDERPIAVIDERLRKEIENINYRLNTLADAVIYLITLLAIDGDVRFHCDDDEAEQKWSSEIRPNMRSTQAHLKRLFGWER
jgi:hypothetical protein